MNNFSGACLSLLYIALVMGAAALLQKRGALQAEGSRKFIHILLSNWWLIALVVYDNPWWAAAVPALFVAVNALSWRLRIFKSMERDGSAADLGTVWYAVTLLVLSLLAFSHPNWKYAATIGILSMGYGDGLAAIAGKRLGKTRFPHSEKTLIGSLTLFAAVFAVALIVSLYMRVAHALSLSLILAAAAALIELATPWGLDNLTLPIGLTLLIPFMQSAPAAMDTLLGAALSLLMILPAWGLRLLTLPAALTAVLMGTGIYFAGGLPMFGALAAFFLSSSLIGLAGRDSKRPVAESVHQRHGARKLIQVLANGGLPLLFALLYRLNWFEPFALAFLGSLAAANADTWASELGMLSKAPPRSLLTGKTVQRGVSGGFTWLGLLGSALGALVVTLVGLFHQPVLGMALSKAAWVGIVFTGGVAGSLVDSLLGDSLQAKFLHPLSGGLTEQPVIGGVSTQLVSGVRCINNDAVNFISAALVSLLMLFLAGQ